MENQKDIVSMQPRPPIVAVLGHVDHGKTSLLDSLRKSNVVSREAGGITQSIGASTIITTTKDGNNPALTGKKITFIDTPGHAAFSQMRSRGSKLADIALLVVAADDGPKPQTIESWEYINASGIPVIVVFTKIDLPSASIEEALPKLEALGIFFEGRGGNVPYIGVSNKTNQGLDDLLELILLVSEVSEIKADPAASLEAVVIETSKDKRGLLASVVVRNGTLKVGQEVWVDGETTKIKGIFDNTAKPLKSVLPGEAGQVLGFSTLPQVGAKVTQEKEIPVQTATAATHPRAKSEEGQLPIFVKTKTAGSLEALIVSLPKGSVVLGSGVGDVTESDVLFAKAAGARIFLFEARLSSQVSKLAETESVTIETFDIIYKLIERIDEIIKTGEIKVLGTAEILAVFPYENKKVAGIKVSSGFLKRGDEVKLMRDNKLSGKVKIVSMRKQKSNITEAKQGEELGIIFEPQFAFEVGDMVVSEAK